MASNAVQQADHRTINTQWIEQRCSFSGTRHHVIAECDGQVAGYCSLERSAEDAASSFRVFLVADWNPNNRFLYEALFDLIGTKISAEKPEYVWMRELVGDASLIEFMQSKGFDISEPYAIDNLEMVNLFKKYNNES